MKTIRLKKYPYFYVKPVNSHGSITIEVAEEPMKIPDHVSIGDLAAKWQYKQLDFDYELVPLHL